MANDLVVRILGDTSGLERSFARANLSTQQFGRSMDTTAGKADKALRSFKGLALGAGAGFAGGLVASEVLNQVRASIEVASNLNEQLSKTNVVFGDSAKVIEDWAKTTADSIGIANDQALAAASTFGTMFDAAGQADADAARLSQRVVTLAADLASFNNTTVDDALTALRSGLSGEIEPLRRFQVFLTEAAVANEAMAASGKKSAQELTQGEKIMARWSLILKQTSQQQGDFARTSEGLANQQRILAANTRDLQANVGQLLIPAMTRLTGALVEATDTAVALSDALKALGDVVIPPIKIALELEIPGTSISGGDIATQIAKRANPWSFFFNVKDLVNAFRGDADPTGPGVNELASQFEKDVGTFVTNLERKTKDAGKRAVSKPSFGEKGFKPVENDLGERLSRQFQEQLDSLSLRFDQAVLTRGTADELGVLDEMRKAVNARIAIHGQTTELLRELFEIDQRRRAVVEGAARDAKDARDATLAKIREAAEHRREIAEKARQALQARQFRALGLSETGDEIVPGIKNLQTRIEGVLRRVGSGDLDISSKLVGRLKLARNLIRKEGKNLTEDTRRVINDLIKTIRDGGDDLAKGPLTETTSLNANRLLEGLGLGRDAEKELRARLSSFNSAGKALAGGGNRPTGSFFVPGSAPTEIHTTVTLDGEVVGRSVRKTNQKNARRNPVQKRGPNRFD